MKSELPKLNLASFDLDDILLIDALTAAEYEFYDTIRIKIGYDKGYEFGLICNNKLESNILMLLLLYHRRLNNPFADSYNQGSSKTWGKDLQSLMDDFPDIRAELTPSRTFSWSDDYSHRLLYSCNGGYSIGGYSIFIDGNFQTAQEVCKEGIRSFLNEAGIDYIVSTPDFHKIWFRVSIMMKCTISYSL